MTNDKSKRFFILFFLALIYCVCAALIMTTDWFLENLPFSGFLIFLLLFLFLLVWNSIKRRRKIAPYVESYFTEKGFKILSERPIKLSELKFKDIKVNVEPRLLGLPLSRYSYVRKFVRVFTVIDEHNKLIEITAEVTYNWNKDLTIEFLGKKEVDNY